MSKTWTEEILGSVAGYVKQWDDEMEKSLRQDVYDSKEPGDDEFLAWMASMIQQYPPLPWNTPEGVVVESLFTLCLRRLEGGEADWKRWVKLTTERSLDEGGY